MVRDGRDYIDYGDNFFSLARELEADWKMRGMEFIVIPLVGFVVAGLHWRSGSLGAGCRLSAGSLISGSSNRGPDKRLQK